MEEQRFLATAQRRKTPRRIPGNSSKEFLTLPADLVRYLYSYLYMNNITEGLPEGSTIELRVCAENALGTGPFLDGEKPIVLKKTGNS